jgi:hypothetical protein
MSRRSERLVQKLTKFTEAIDEVEHLIADGEDPEGISLVCLPPTSNIDSDLEDITEDNLENEDVTETVGELEVQVEEPREDTPEPPVAASVGRKRKAPVRSKRTVKEAATKDGTPWQDGETHFVNPIMEGQAIQPLAECFPDLAGLSPYHLFLRYFDGKVMNLITTESERYARQKNDPSK